MEEIKKNQPNEGSVNIENLSKDSLKKLYAEVSLQNQALSKRFEQLLGKYNEAMAYIQQKNFDSLAFFLQMLFKVVEHPEMYTADFVKWSTDNIESALTEFAASNAPAEKENTEKKDEA